MKKHLLLLFLFFGITQAGQAQDLIITIKGEELTGKITEVTQNDIVYRQPDSLHNLPLTIPKKQVFMIKYENGSKEVITQEHDSETETLSPEAMFSRGQADARKYYRGNDVMWGSAAASVFFPYGYAVPIVLGLTKPRIKPYQLPEKSLLQNRNYVRGYENQAHKRKVGKAAAGAGIGTGVVVGILIYFISTF